MQLLDDNLDGFITLDELRAAFKNASAATGGKVEVPSDETLRAMIAEVDADADGKLTEDDFKELVKEAAAKD
jgi:Ca2+-binding EF-hand superfamily protein